MVYLLEYALVHGGFCVATPFRKAVTTPLPYPISKKGGCFEKQSFSLYKFLKKEQSKAKKDISGSFCSAKDKNGTYEFIRGIY